MISYFLWLGIPIALIILGIVIASIWPYSDELAFASFIIIGIVLLIMSLALWGGVYATSKSNILQFKEIVRTVQDLRENGDKVELAALNIKIIEANKWLAGTQYWASKPVLDLFFPDEILDLQPIK